jgi:hypothetical protein
VERAVQASCALVLAFHCKTLARKKLDQQRTEFRVVIDQ